MKTCYLLTWYLLLLSAPLQAQFYLGVEAGATRNALNTDISNRPQTAYRMRYGFEAGVPVRYAFNNWLSVQTGLQYVQKNYEWYRSGYYDGVYEKTVNSYLQLPVFAHLSFGSPKVKGFLDIGGYTARWITGKRKGAQPNFEDVMEHPGQNNTIFDQYRPYHYNEKYEFNATRDRRQEWGGLAGVGVEYTPSGRCVLFIASHYTVSFTDQQKDYMIHRVPRYNETISLKLGGMVRISR